MWGRSSWTEAAAWAALTPLGLRGRTGLAKGLEWSAWLVSRELSCSWPVSLWPSSRAERQSRYFILTVRRLPALLVTVGLRSCPEPGHVYNSYVMLCAGGGLGTVSYCLVSTVSSHM